MKNIYLNTYNKLSVIFGGEINPILFSAIVFDAFEIIKEKPFNELDFHQRLIVRELIDLYYTEMEKYYLIIKNAFEKSLQLEYLSNEELINKFKESDFLASSPIEYLASLLEINRRTNVFDCSSIKGKLLWISLMFNELESTFNQLSFNRLSLSPFYSNKEINLVPEDKIVVLVFLEDSSFNDIFLKYNSIDKTRDYENKYSFDISENDQIDSCVLGGYDETDESTNPKKNIYCIKNIEEKNKSRFYNSELPSLTYREEKVLRLRYGIDDGKEKTLEETGKELGVTR